MAERTCSVVGCEQASRKRSWCPKHYDRWRRHGTVSDEAVKWVVGERGTCTVCGSVVPAGSPFRRYCGWACSATGTRQRTEPRVPERPCAKCGAPISLTTRSESGRLAMANRRLCGECAPRPSLRRFRQALIARGDTECHLCGAEIDMTLRFPDRGSVMVDHILPRSRGGLDVIENLALAHWGCNHRKRASVKAAG